MKRKLLIVLVLLIVLGISSCNKKNQKTEETITTQTEETTTTEEGTETKATESITSEGEHIVEIYVGNGDATGLIEETVVLEEVTAESIVEELKKAGIFGGDTKVLSFAIKDNIATLDLSALPSTGTAGESVMLAVIGNTFTKTFHVDKVRLLINGENYSSGHLEFTDEDFLTYNEDYETLLD